MTASVRYKLVRNTTGRSLNYVDIPAGDGDDKLYRVINRVFSAEDIGTGPGQTQNASGCIVDKLPEGTNILALEGRAYKIVENEAFGDALVGVSYIIDTYNGIRVRDQGTTAAQQLAPYDYVIIKLTIGPA